MERDCSNAGWGIIPQRCNRIPVVERGFPQPVTEAASVIIFRSNLALATKHVARSFPKSTLEVLHGMRPFLSQSKQNMPNFMLAADWSPRIMDIHGHIYVGAETVRSMCNLQAKVPAHKQTAREVYSCFSVVFGPKAASFLHEVSWWYNVT
jgi:hypothetical protein